MSVWLTIPSARPPEECEPVLKAWRERGYRIALLRNDVLTISTTHLTADWVFWQATDVPYNGYAASVNFLIAGVLKMDPDAEWFIAAGDDTLPDPNHTAEEIALQCADYFRNMNIEETGETIEVHPTLGVMQPIGDDFGANPDHPDPAMRTPYIHRVAGSAWIGREFARRMYGGRGPLYPGYFHMGCDEELQAVATKLGVFWQRQDLTHHHQHWGRPREGEKMGRADRMPKFLARANSPAEWQKYKKLFAERKAAGFPGSDPI